MLSARKAAITGAPGAGKSTLLAELARRGIATEAEGARAILAAPGGMELRAERPLDFALAMFEAELRTWNAAEARGGVTVFDRGFPDIVGFLRLEGFAVPAEIDRACRSLRYDGPIFRAPAWRAIYRRDSERIQSWEEAVASDDAVTRAWRDYGYDPVDLPLAGIAERAAFVETCLDG